MAELLRVDPQDELVFEPAAHAISTSSMQLCNQHTQNLAFKPNKGILEPGERRTVNLTLKPLPADCKEINHKFNIVYAPTALTTSQETDLTTFWLNSKNITKSIILRTTLKKLKSSFSSPIIEPIDPRPESADIGREYKKLMLFSQQQSQDRDELTRKLSMLQKEDKERTEQETKRMSPSAPTYTQLHLFLVVLLGLLVGSVLFRS